MYAYQHWPTGAPWADPRLGLWLVAYLALAAWLAGVGEGQGPAGAEPAAA